MNIESLEKRLEKLTKTKKKKAAKASSSRSEAYAELHADSSKNRKRQLIMKICMAEYGISSYEFYNKIIDHLMEKDSPEFWDSIFLK